MRNFFLWLALVVIATQATSSACVDTTLTIVTGSPGFDMTTGVYDPSAAGALESVFTKCAADSTLTVKLQFVNAPRGDTLRLQKGINLSTRSGKVTVIRGQGTNDSIVTLLETSTSDPTLFTAQSGNVVNLVNLGFARKFINGPAGTISSVSIAAKGTKIQDCHFWMADTGSQGPGPLVDVMADSVLVERCLFRTIPGGTGRTLALRSSSTANKLEIRSCIFVGTGLYLNASGAAHVYANTFTGTRQTPNLPFITISGTATGPATTDTLFSVQHNLFVPRDEAQAPITYASTSVVTAAKILGNAWSSRVGVPSQYLVVNGSGSPVTLNNAIGGNANTALPRGFSNYGTAAPEVKDYPVTELRKEPSLSRNGPDFGKIYYLFANNTWTTISAIGGGITAGQLYFPNFTPFLPTRSWASAINIKVGALVDLDTIQTPTPLDSGAQGASLKFVKHTDSTKIKLTRMSFNDNYYKTRVVPEFLYYFFSNTNTLSKLMASNDSSVLKTAVGTSFIRINFLDLATDSTVLVPKEVRTGGDIFVKMLHYKSSWQAPVLSSAVIATVTGVPSFPSNDLTLAVVAGTSVPASGSFNLTVTRGSEGIDSVAVVAATGSGTPFDTIVQAAANLNFHFILPQGTFYFYAYPIAKLNGISKMGSATLKTATVISRPVIGDSIFVNLQSGCTPVLSQNLYCTLDTAMKLISAKGTGGTILVSNSGPPVYIDSFAVQPSPLNSTTDTAAITIINSTGTGTTLDKYPVNRPIFRGKGGKEALRITRKNVTLKGFIIEMPSGSPTKAALNVTGGGCVIDGNIFRVNTKTASVDGPGVNVEVGTQEIRFMNNVVWGFTKSVQISNSPSTGIRILNNTFMADASLPNAASSIGVTIVGSATNVIIANNFFSGIKSVFDATVKPAISFVSHNAFMTGADLGGVPDAGGLDPVSGLDSVDLTTATSGLESSLGSAFNCSSLSPCTALYAGSSTEDFKVNITTDVLGKPRVGKIDVGAFESTPVTGAVSGRLSVTASGTTFNTASCLITSKNFDPLEQDSVYIWWSTNPLATKLDNIQPEFVLKHSIKDFASGQLTENVTGLSGLTKYYFFAALGKTDGSGRSLGYAYHDSATTLINAQTGDCILKGSFTTCPTDKGYFDVVGGNHGRYRTRFSFSQPLSGSDTGIVKSPEFADKPLANSHNLNLESVMPPFTFTLAVPGLGASGSNQSFTATIEMDFAPPLAGKELFLLPTDSLSLPTYVPTWKMVTEGGVTKLIIEGTKGGVLKYAFGTLADTALPGTIVPKDSSPSVFDYVMAGDSINHVPVKIEGKGFKTSNPLVLVSVVPAGGVASDVFSGKYPAANLVFSSEIGELSDSLRKDRFYRYYSRAAAVDSVTPNPAGQKKPFALIPVTAGAFDSATQSKAPSLAFVGSGSLAPTTLQFPLSRSYHDNTPGRGGSRTFEVEYTVFDGSKISRSHSYIRTKFNDTYLYKDEKKQFAISAQWNLFAYPWAEVDSGNLARVVGGTKWNHNESRLFKYVGDGAGKDGYAEYLGSKESDFPFDSAHAVWTASIQPYYPRCGTGMSLDYQTFSLPLDAGKWTDIGLPFNFPMRLSDINDASNLAASTAIFRYNADKKNWAALDLKKDVIFPWDGLTIKSPAIANLRFPVLDTSRSQNTPATKSAAGTEKLWEATVMAYNSTASMTLKLGNAGQERVYTDPPNVPGQNFRAGIKHTLLDGRQETLSQHILPSDGVWQGHWPISLSMLHGSEGISLKVADNSVHVPIYLLESLHKTEMALGKDSLNLSAGDIAANDYHLVVGDENYRKSLLESLGAGNFLALANYPNPFSVATMLRYRVPAGYGSSKFHLLVRDFRGRTVWEQNIISSTGLNLSWNGRDLLNQPLPSGVYNLSLEVKPQNRPVLHAQRRLLKL